MKCIFLTLLISILLFGCSSPNKLYNSVNTADSIKNIHASTDAIRLLTEDTQIVKETKSIDVNTDKIGEANKNLVKDLENANKTIQSNNERYEKLYKTTLITVIIASGLGLTVLTILFFLGSLKSIVPAIILGGLLVGSIMLYSLYAYFLYIGIVVAIILAVTLIYVVYTKKKALHQTITTVDEAKKAGAIDWNKFTQVAEQIQSKNTQKIIENMQK